MTLVEVLVALLLLSFGLAGVVDLYRGQLRHLSLTRRQGQSLELAHGYLAQLQAAGYDALDQAIRRKDPAGSADEVSLNPFPVAAKEGGAIGRPAKWNAHLRRETLGGIACIRVSVEVLPESPGPGATSSAGSASARRKEVVGYAVSTATP